jgi:ABC-2 type transport system permease protein
VTRLVRSEVLKLRTVWSTWVILLVGGVATAALGLLVAFAPHRRALAQGLFPARGTPAWYDDVFSLMGVATTLALILGIISMTGEYRHRTITPTLLAEPRRGRTVSAKFAVSAAGGAVVALCAGATALVLGFALVAGGYGTQTIMLTEYRHVFPGILAASVLYAVYGLGLGAILKNQVVALVVALGFEAVVTPIFVGVLPSVGRYFPSQAGTALESVAAAARRGSRGLSTFGSNSSHLLTWWEGALVLLGYGVLLAVAGTLTTLRADVT